MAGHVMDERLRGHLDEMAPRIAWDEFVTYHFDWKQNQHVALIGPTDSGKTTLALAILPMRKYIAVLATKPKDSTLSQFGKSEGFKRYTHWPEIHPGLSPRRLVWPDATSLYSAKEQQLHFKKALDQIYREGAWCVYIDELWFIGHHLKMDFEVRTYLQQARSNDISLVVATQRPAWVPLEVYDQSQHLFFWRDNDERNLNRLSGISWRNGNYVRALIAELPQHEILYVHVPTGAMFRTMAPVKGGS